MVAYKEKGYADIMNSGVLKNKTPPQLDTAANGAPETHRDGTSK